MELDISIQSSHYCTLGFYDMMSFSAALLELRLVTTVTAFLSLAVHFLVKLVLKFFLSAIVPEMRFKGLLLSGLDLFLDLLKLGK